MRTEFNQENADFSGMAHLAAQNQLYPFYFVGMDLGFDSTCMHENESNTLLDAGLSIDRMVKVSCGLFLPLTFSVQERFRREKFRKWQDVTLTEWNHNSDLPSELYKIQADLFVYGYYNEHENKILQALVISVFDLKKQILNRKLSFRRERNKKNQTFITIKFNDIIENPLIDSYHFNLAN